MFEETLAEYTGMTAPELHDEMVRLELERRALDARALAVRAAAEARDVPGLDGHRSMQAYLRATCNQGSAVARMEVRRARFCRDFPHAGDALMVGRVGVAQIDELVRIQRNPRAAKYLDDAAVDMLLEHAEHLPCRSFGEVVDRWLMWADADGAWRDQCESIDNRTAHVVAASGEVIIGVSGGDALTAEKLRNIFTHFVEIEFRKDCDARRAMYGDRADEHPLPRTDAQRRFDAFAAIFERAYTAGADGKPLDPLINILIDQRTFQDVLSRAGIVLADGQTLDLDTLTKAQIEAVLAEFVDDPATMLTRRCETTSGQQVPAQLLIQALLTAQVRRVVLDAKSTVIDLGERKRLFTGNSRVAATILGGFCHHQGCEIPADCCEIDHNEPHSQGGLTDQLNAGPLCGPHNRHKHANGWRTRRADNGRIYNIRADGTIVLFAGERPPRFGGVDKADEDFHSFRQRIRYVNFDTAQRVLSSDFVGDRVATLSLLCHPPGPAIAS